MASALVRARPPGQPRSATWPPDERRGRRAIEHTAPIGHESQFLHGQFECGVGRVEGLASGQKRICDALFGRGHHGQRQRERGEQHHHEQRDDERGAAIRLGFVVRHRARFMFRGVISNCAIKSGTKRSPNRAVPPRAKSAPAGPRSDASADCTRSVTWIRRIRRRSASKRFGERGSGHQGPSVRDAGVSSTRARPPGASVTSLGVWIPSTTAKVQFSPGGHEPRLVPRGGGGGPYVVHGPPQFRAPHPSVAAAWPIRSSGTPGPRLHRRPVVRWPTRRAASIGMCQPTGLS